MKQLLPLLIAGCLLSYAPKSLAAEWVKVAENSVNDRFFVDKGSMQRQGDIVRYWEYREFQQPNNAFLEETVDKPVYGVVMSWSLDCAAKVQRLRQVTAYDRDRKVIQKFAYGDSGSLVQPKPGSSASRVLDYVCTSKEQSGSSAEPPQQQ